MNTLALLAAKLRATPREIAAAEDIYDRLKAAIAEDSRPRENVACGYVGCMFGIHVYVDPDMPPGTWKWVEPRAREKEQPR